MRNSYINFEDKTNISCKISRFMCFGMNLGDESTINLIIIEIIPVRQINSWVRIKSREKYIKLIL